MTSTREPPASSPPLDDLLRREFVDLRLDDYAPLFSCIAAEQSPINDSASSSCHGVVQYWDHQPDDDVSSLLETTRQACKRAGVPWHFFDHDAASAFLAQELGPAYRRAYDKCLHPAQRSDFFRYCFLYRRGGMWLDADLVLTASPAFLLNCPRPVFFQRKDFHGGITNAFLYTPPGDPVFASIVATCLGHLEDETFYRDCATNRDILSSTGVIMINRVVASYAHAHLASNTPSDCPMRLIDETTHQQFIERGERFLGRPLAYKRTKKAWQAWCREAPGNPLEPDTLRQLKESTLRR